MSELLWPTARELRIANAAGRALEIELAQAERESTLTRWRNSINDSLVNVVENKWQAESITIQAPTPNILISRPLLPILVAWLKGMLPGFQIVGEEVGNCAFIVISWKDESL